VSQAPPRRSILVAAAAAAVLLLAGCGDESTSPSQSPAPAAPLPTFAPTGQVTCSEEAYQAKPPAAGWTHPSQNYYAPGQADMPTAADLEHLLAADSAVVVRYRPDAPRERREALKAFAASGTAIVVLPARTRDDAAVEAFTVNRRLLCDGVDAAQLTVFAQRRGSLDTAPHDETG